ncbi:MAG: extracellular solute-binding protein [Actinocatenispora sp.]
MTAAGNGHPHELSRRSVLRLAGTAGVAATLAGCGRGLGGGSSSDSANLQMMFWGEGDQNTKLMSAISAWQKKDGKTHVDTQYMGLAGYFDKLATRLAGGNPPDLFQIYLPYLADYVSRDVIMPLDDYADQLGLENLPASIMPTSKMAGHYYFAIVGAATQPAIEYDSNRLTKYSLRPASNDWTLADFQDVMKQVHTTSKGALHGISDLGGGAVQLESYMRAFDTPLFDGSGALAFSRDQFEQWLHLWDTLRRNGSCPPMTVTAAATGFETDPIVTGKAAYTLTATSRGFPSIQSLTKDRLGLLQFPRATADSRPGTNIIPAGWFAIAKKSKNAGKAVALLKYLSSDPHAARLMGLARGVPLSTSQQDAIKGNLNSQEKLVFDNYTQIAGQDLAPLQVYPPGSGELLTTSLSNANQSVGFGKAGVRQATTQFFADAKRILK